MGTVVVTGSAGGICGATAARLRARGERVIGVDVHDADVIADLSTPDGRTRMIEEVGRLTGGALDGVVAGAGVNGKPGQLTAAINYFGAVATLEGLRPLLANGTNAAAVAISSNSASTQPGVRADVVEGCLAGDEAAVLALLADDPTGLAAYAASKLALARWVRRQATTPAWVGAGIRLNAVAPGFIATAMTEGMEDFIYSIPDVFPMPIGRAGTAEEIAAVIDLLLGPDGGFFCGSVLFADGGTDAAVRPDDYPTARPG